MQPQTTLTLAVAENRHSALQRHPLFAGDVAREQHALVNVYYDTGRLALRRAGLVMCLRRDGSNWLQILSRREHAADEAHGIQWRTPYRNRFDFSEVGDAELRDWLEREKVIRRVAPVFETSVRRTRWHLAPKAGVRIRATLDRGWIAANGRREAVSELQLRLVAGNADALYELALDLARSQALPPLLWSITERGYRLLRNSPLHPVRAGVPDITATTTPLAAFRLIALDCLSHLQLNHAGAIESEDPEYVHQMRVAARRLRAALRMFGPALPDGLEDALAPPLRELMASLGQTRDLDVLMEEIVAPVCRAMPDEPRLADLAGAIINRQYRARAETRQTLRQSGYCRLLLEAGRLLHQPVFLVPATVETEPTLPSFAERRLRRLLRRIHELAEVARIDYPPSLHELRIAIKRMRYAIEFFDSMIQGKAGTTLIKRLAALQEELGQLNDLASAGTLLMVCAGREPQLREGVTLIGGWHGPRHAAMLAAIEERLQNLRALKMPRLVAR